MTLLAGLQGVVSRARQRAEVRFVVSFVTIAGVLFAVYSFPYPDGSAAQRWSESYLSAYAHLAGWVLGLFDSRVSVSRQDIGGQCALRIIRGCDAIDVQILLLAAVVASDAYSWRWRLGGVLAGLGLLTAANVARIGCLYWVGAFLPAYFAMFHHEIWPLALIGVAGVAFVVWSRLGQAREGLRRGAA